MPEFKTLEEKFLFESEKNEERLAELEEENDELKRELSIRFGREKMFVELLSLLGVHYHDCTTTDEPMIDCDTLYPHDKEPYGRALDIIKTLGLVFRNR